MPPAASADRRILVIGPSWVGDAVMSQCLLKAIKARDPSAAIDIFAPPALAPLYGRMPEVAAVLPSPFGHRDFRPLRRVGLGRALAGRYEAVYVLPGSWKSAILPFAARIPRRCGYLGEARRGLLNDIRALPASLKRKTAIAYQALAEPEIVTDPSRLRAPAITVDAENRGRLLQTFGLSPAGFAAFVPGAEYGPAKRWPLRHWIALAERLERAGLRAVLFGSKNDADVGAEIARGRPAIVDLTGRTRLEDAIDLISAAEVAVTNDSGLMHVAAAVGCKVVALYGSTSPDDTPALSAAARFVTLRLPCSPCRKRICPLGHLDCLEKLDPAEAMRALAELGGRAASSV